MYMHAQRPKGAPYEYGETGRRARRGDARENYYSKVEKTHGQPPGRQFWIDCTLTNLLDSGSLSPTFFYALTLE